MQKFYFVQYEYGTVLAKDQQMAAEALANGKNKDSQSLVVIAPKAGEAVFPNLSQREVMERIVYLQLAIIWTVSHFEIKAQELEKTNSGSLYDCSKFEEALVTMMANHDRNEGINWETVAYYLNEYCLLD